MPQAAFFDTQLATHVRVLSPSLLSQSTSAITISPVTAALLRDASGPELGSIPDSTSPAAAASAAAWADAQASSALLGQQLYAPRCALNSSWADAQSFIDSSGASLAVRVCAGESVVLLADVFLMQLGGTAAPTMLQRPVPIDSKVSIAITRRCNIYWCSFTSFPYADLMAPDA